jgi:hypothetical protein
MQQYYPCPNCGNQINYGLRFCPSCGVPLIWKEQIVVPAGQQVQMAAPFAKPVGRNNSAAKVVAVVLAVIIVLAIAGVIGYGQLAPLPVVSGVTASSVTTSSAVITWTTDIPSTSQVEYGTSSQYGLFTVVDQNSIINHRVTLEGLNPGLTYYCRARSKSSNWNDAISSGITFDTMRGQAGQ